MAGVQERACRRVVVVVCAAALGALCACGGGGGSAAPAPVAVRTGDIGLQVAWPEGRLVPSASASIKVEVLRNGTLVDGATTTIDAPATTGRINGVVTGDVTLRATAYPQAGAQGTAQATGDLAVTVEEGFKEYGTLTMASTIASFAVTPNPATVATAGTVTLTATAKNAADQVVLLPDTASWSIETGSDFVSLPSSRAVSSYSVTVTAKAAGQATVKVTFTEGTGSPRGASVTVNVTDNVTITVAPTTLSGPTGSRRQFTATVTGTANQAVTWSVQEGVDGGTVSATGLYIGGATAGTFHVVATSQADGTKSAAATVTLQSPAASRQFGTAQVDRARGVAVDTAGNSYVCGETSGALGGPSAGNFDAFVAKYDTSSDQVWLRQFGTTATDNAYGVAVDGAGNTFVFGYTKGSLGGPNAGDYDIWLAKYDSAGTQIWLKQFGTAAADLTNGGVAVDASGNVFLCGYTSGSLGGPTAGQEDAWIAKYDTDGQQLWLKQFGSSANDRAFALGVSPSGNVMVGGLTLGALGGANAGAQDGWVARYDADGNQLWLRQYGSSTVDVLYGLAVDPSGNVFVSGNTLGNLGQPSAGSTDCYVVKYDLNGQQLWIRQFGSTSGEVATALAADPAGDVFLFGSTNGDLGGPSAGDSDLFVARYDSSGSQLWVRQSGSPASDNAIALALDNLGFLRGAGNTRGNLVGPGAGSDDAFLLVLDQAGNWH